MLNRPYCAAHPNVLSGFAISVANNSGRSQAPPLAGIFPEPWHRNKDLSRPYCGLQVSMLSDAAGTKICTSPCNGRQG